MSKFKKLGFLASYAIPLLILGGYYGPSEPITYFTPPFAYLLVPVFDLLLGKDKSELLETEISSSRFFDFLVYSHVYIQFFLLGWGLWVLGHDVLSPRQIIGIFVSQGIYSATIINVAHELGHRKSPAARWHARLALISVCYHHFYIEHNRGHHVHVATPADPATSKVDQSLFAFWIQTIVGSFKSAWRIEEKSLTKKHQSVWSFQNQVLTGLLATALFFSLLVVLAKQMLNFNPYWSLFFLLCQSLMAILLLEAVNYIEHYGMMRVKLPDGRYEKVKPTHSWNASHYFSNLLLFNLQRHSDHHANASRPYQHLRHFDESPQLPFGYPLMIIISLCPPLWYKMMNDRLKRWQNSRGMAQNAMQ